MKQQKILRAIAWIIAVSGIAFITGGYWRDLFDPFIFDQTGNLRTDGVFHFLSPMLREMQSFVYHNEIMGVPLLLCGVLGILLTRRSATKDKGGLGNNRFGLAAIGVAALAHILVVISSLHLFMVPEGRGIRPMNWTYLMTVLAFWACIFVVPTAGLAVKKERPRYVGGVGLLLGLTPLLFAAFVLVLASWCRGFYLLP